MEQNKKATSVICTINKLNEENHDIKFKKFFTIPTYQRLYAWKDEQIKALLDDFKNCIEHNKQEDKVKQKSHFIGNIVVSEYDGKYVLIDGQQRLTTIWLVLKYLLQEQFRKENYFDIEMPIRKEDIQAINEYCGSNKKSLDECFNDTNNTNAGFKNAFKIFEVYFGKDDKENKEEDKKYKQQFIKFIKEQVKFNLVILGDQVELNKYFVRMNNTGVQLDGTDILKARLLKLISDKDKNKVTKYARIFDECSQMNYFSDFGFVDNKDDNTDDSKNKPTIENIINNENKLQNYSNNDKDRAEFESIIDFPTFVLHVFKILSRQELEQKSDKKIFKDEIQISIKKDKFLENTWDKLNVNLDAEQAITIIEALKEYRTIFDTFVIKRKSDDDENVYKLWNRFKKNDKNIWDEVKDIEENKNSLKNLAIIQNYLRVARRGDNTNYHHFLTHYLEFCKKRILESKTYLETLQNKAEELKNYLKNLDTALAYKSLEEDNTNSLLDIADDFKNENKNYELKDNCFNFLNNGTNTPHYWFYRLEYYLLTGNHFKDENNEIKKDFKQALGSYRFRYVSSIEHVYPQHNKDGRKLNANLDCFGNLALISSGENSEFSNKPFNEKKSQFDSYLKKGLVISLKLLDIYKNEEYQKDENGNRLINQIWQKTQIEDHQEAMLGVLKNSFFNSQEQVKNN